MPSNFFLCISIGWLKCFNTLFLCSREIFAVIRYLQGSAARSEKQNFLSSAALSDRELTPWIGRLLPDPLFRDLVFDGIDVQFFDVA